MPSKRLNSSIDWKRVELVYEDDGRKVPAMLQKLRGTLAQARDAYSFFATELVHQDATSPGALVVAPLLVPFAQDPKCKVAGPLLQLLGTLACDGDPMQLLSAQPRPVDAGFLSAAQQCRESALALLRSRDERARIGAAFLLASLREDRAALAQTLRDALKGERSAVVRATLLFGLVIHAKPKAERPLFERALGAKAAIERLAGLLGLAMAGPLPSKAAAVAGQLLDAEDEKTFPWRQGNITLLTVDLLRFVAARDGDPAVLLGLLDSPRAHLIIPAVAPALFPRKVKAAALDDAQRGFLDVVTSDASHFRLVQELLVQRGLPGVALELRRTIGLTAEDPLDRTWRFEGHERSLRDLMTLAAKSPQKRAAIATAVTEGSSGEEVMGLAVQTCRAQLRGQDADGALVADRVASALLAACRDERGILKQLREFNFYGEVQDPSGAIFLIENLRTPIALELARRTKHGEDKRFDKLTASAFDNKWAAPMWKDVLLALDPARRTRILRGALFDWMYDVFRPACVPALLETPNELLAKLVREQVKRWKDRYAQERKGNGHQFLTDELDAKKLKALAPRDHPRIDELAGPTRAYVEVLRDAKLGKAADALEKDLEAFLSM